jgi:hypothetical protein
MHDALPRSIPIHVLAHPPFDFSLIEEYKNAGATSIAFNLEVFDRSTFAELCPGKNRDYGYDRWLDSLMCAKEVFGKYNAYCGLVWGLESPENTIEGNSFFIERGIGIASNIFHSDPTCILRHHAHPSEETIMQIVHHQMQIYRCYPEARTIFPASMRSTLDWEIMRESRT